ncbi:unnamed protein product [Spirodela intermedia]|uniref:Uncharacterized protein n=1 Tax=Spirodela intermedia TaxID=51605 RepID=A0A7I8JEI2_SPIIN|nr:unnamed protein product [Spirodela intermedia]CAA6668564.1 unnamed protein product [Spirodela intermedia]
MHSIFFFLMISSFIKNLKIFSYE